MHGREEKSVHNHHRKKIFWRTCLASKKNFPGRWWIQKPYKHQESHIHHRHLSSVDPIFFCKEKFCTGAGRCMVSFSQHGAILNTRKHTISAPRPAIRGWDPSSSHRTCFQGRTSPAFSKPCLCLSDTRHFRRFCRFRGSEERKPLFSVGNSNSSFSPFLSKQPLFGRGQKHSLPKNGLCRPER